MVSINGLPPASGANRANKAKKTSNKKAVNQSGNESAVNQPTKVANAVAQSIRQMDPADIGKAQVQYDLPEGRGRKAMQEYMKVMNQAKHDQLTQMLGVDFYI